VIHDLGRGTEWPRCVLGRRSGRKALIEPVQRRCKKITTSTAIAVMRASAGSHEIAPHAQRWRSSALDEFGGEVRGLGHQYSTGTGRASATGTSGDRAPRPPQLAELAHGAQRDPCAP